jgi:hypothetical protein
MEWKSPDPELKDHVVICNCNDQVRRIVGELHIETLDHRPDIVLVVQDGDLWERNPSWHPDPRNEYTREHFFVLIRSSDGLLSHALRRVNIAKARAAVILADPHHGEMGDARSTLMAVAIERENPQVHTVMELISSVNRAHLRATEVNEVVCQGELSEKLIAQSCITPGVKNIFWSLLTNAPGTNNIYITALPSEAVGSTYRELARQLIKARAPMILVGYLRPKENGNGEPGCGAGSKRKSSRDSITSNEAESGIEYVINPRKGYEPGRDSMLLSSDQLVFVSCKPPCVDRYL